MAKFELDTHGKPEGEVSKKSGMELDIKGVPPSFPGHGSGGSHVSNYDTNRGAFEMSYPPVGMDKPIESLPVVNSTGGMKMRNDTAGDKGGAKVMPGMNGGGATHNVFSSLSTDGQGRGVSDRKTEIEMFKSNAGQRDMNPPIPKKAGGSALKGLS